MQTGDWLINNEFSVHRQIHRCAKSIYQLFDLDFSTPRKEKSLFLSLAKSHNIIEVSVAVVKPLL